MSVISVLINTKEQHLLDYSLLNHSHTLFSFFDVFTIIQPLSFDDESDAPITRVISNNRLEHLLIHPELAKLVKLTQHFNGQFTIALPVLN